MPMSDKEEVQMVKAWWKEYGYYILFTVLFVLAANFGWRRYQQHQDMRLEQASTVYMQMLNFLEQKKNDEVKLFGEKLIKDHEKSVYASLAALFLAKIAVHNGDLKLADEKLKFVIKRIADKKIRQIARIRDARVLIAMKKSQEAVDLLEHIDDKSYLADINEVLGDALLDIGKIDEAEQAYKKAKSMNDNNKLQSPLLKIKMQL
jgi:predicted negative regulator of RcsB-dependent stress response